MIDQIKHECGIGLIRLKKPLSYYREKYGTPLWGLNKMYLLMEKQHNRGQDGAGLACVKLNVREGVPYLSRARNNEASPWIRLNEQIGKELDKITQHEPFLRNDPDFLYDRYDYAGELLLAHLRYATHGENSINACHPVLRSNNWRSRSLVIAGNFNLTNVEFLFEYLVELGQHPRYLSDTETVLERIGHFLDEENERLFKKFKRQKLPNYEISRKIAEELDVRGLIRKAASKWDGGYVMGGLMGHGDAFVARDPHGIRPGFYLENDEVIAVASERPAIATVFNVNYDEIKEIKPAHVLVIKKDGTMKEMKFMEPGEKQSCSFERIYFSRGNDLDIYQERLNLGRMVVPKVLEAVNHDLDNTVFSYIPNTAETAFLGMIKGLESHMNAHKIRKIKEMSTDAPAEEIENLLNMRPRVEKAVLKDAKLRTFITADSARDDLVAHVYDITHGVLRPGKDNFVCIDDSIVRGTTLKKSILQILARLKPRKIVIVSSAPQIRYPDCYGIDMSQIHRFVAFQAAIALLKERGMENTIQKVYQECGALRAAGLLDSKNVVKKIYQPFTEDQISKKISEILTPEEFPIKVEIVYQPLANLKGAIPGHTGDWYFSGNYPTPGGNKVTNQAFINFYEGKDVRAY